VKLLVLLTEEDPEANWDNAGEGERDAIMRAHDDYAKAVRERGSILSGEALGGVATARTLRTVDGKRQVTDGPYAETVEQLGGFYLLDLPDLETALDLCRLLPDHYVIEVRPAIDIEGDDPEAGA
jgi:hypothetical protein